MFQGFFAALLCLGAVLSPALDIEGSLVRPEEVKERLPGRVVQAFSFGQIQVFTDWSLLRMLTDVEVRWVRPGQRASQFFDLNLAIELDPFFYEIYSEGPRFLAVIRNDKESALELALKGLAVQRNRLSEIPASRIRYVWPSHFDIPFVLGYVYLFEKPDLARAAEAYSEAARAPESPPYVAALGAHLSDPTARFGIGIRVLTSMKTNAKTDAEKQRFDTRIKNLYLIQFLTQIRTEFDAFLQEQPDYRRAINLPPAQMKSLFARFVVKNRMEAIDPYGGRVHMDESGQVTTTTPYESEMGLR